MIMEVLCILMYNYKQVRPSAALASQRAQCC